MIKNNWKAYLLGLFSWGVVILLVLHFTSEKKQVQTISKTTQTSSETISSHKTEAKESKNNIGTLTNPVPFGDYAIFSDKGSFGDETSFDIEAKVDEFKPAKDLENFQPRFYNSGSLKENYTYYGVKMTVSIVDGTDPNKTYNMDVLNNIHVYIDGAESSDNVIDINQNGYSGLDAKLSIGAKKTGWFGFQVPSSAKHIMVKFGSYNSDFYMTLK